MDSVSVMGCIKKIKFPKDSRNNSIGIKPIRRPSAVEQWFWWKKKVLNKLQKIKVLSYIKKKTTKTIFVITILIIIVFLMCYMKNINTMTESNKIVYKDDDNT